MTHTFKKGLRGFTLIELLVVIAIIGLLSTVIAGPVQTGLKKGRDARKVADMKQIQSALAQYAADNGGTYPATLDGLAPSYLATTTAMGDGASARDKIMYVTYSVNGDEVFYHLGVALENQSLVLQSDADCYTTSCHAGTPAFSNLGTTFGSGNPEPGAGATDFNGAGTAEVAGGTCTNTLSTCIYDVTPQ